LRPGSSKSTVVLQVVDLARLEPHLDVEGRVLGNRVDQVEELGLLGREPRHLRVALGLADVPGDVEEGETPILVAADGQLEERILALGLLVVAIPVEGLVEQRDQVGPAPQDLVVERRRAHEPVLAARAPLSDAEQRHEVRAVAVEAQIDAGLVEAHRRVLGIGAGIAHVSEHVARGVLGDGHAHVQAEAPVEDGDLLVVVVIHRDPLDVDEAATVLEGLHPLRDGRGQHGEREVVARQLGHRLAGGPRDGQRVLEVGNLGGREAAHPVAAAQLRAEPGGGCREGLAGDRGHADCISIFPILWN
jgi:hypothetical protein